MMSNLFFITTITIECVCLCMVDDVLLLFRFQPQFKFTIFFCKHLHIHTYTPCIQEHKVIFDCFDSNENEGKNKISFYFMLTR